MATLEKIRNRAGLLIIVVGLALLAFILGDFLRSGSTFFQQSKNVALNIDGEKVSAQEFQERLQQVEEMQGSGVALDNEQKMSINNGLASYYVTKHMFDKKAEEIGLSVSAKEVAAMLYGEGMQQAAMLGQFLSQIGVDSKNPRSLSEFLEMISEKSLKGRSQEERSYLSNIRSQFEIMQEQTASDRKREKLFSLLERSVAINKIDAHFYSGVPNREVAVVRTSSASIPETAVKVEDADIKKYYDSHKELYKMKYPTTEMQYISVEIRPSARDFKAAETEMTATLAAMQTEANVEDALRNTSDKFIAQSYLTLKEVKDLRIGSEVEDFLSTAQVGQVNMPELVANNYTLIKLIGKKNTTEGVHLQMMALDSASMDKVDSIRTQFAAGTSFADLARKYSADPATASNGGYVLVPNMYGGADSVITEFQAHRMDLDTIFKAPVGQLLSIERNGFSLLALTSKPQAAVDKYKFAVAKLAATFSEETYNEAYTKINNILLNGGGKFDHMAKAAKEQGLRVVESEIVTHDAPMLGRIRSSREIVHWGLNAKAGAVNDRIFRCGQDYLVLAAVKNQYEAGYKPMQMVQDEIRMKLLNDKRSEKLAADLKAKNLTTLEDYASAMQSSIDTLSGISYLVRGAQPAELSAYAMTTAMQQLSSPFVAGSEVVVLKPMKENKTLAGQTQEDALQQMRRSLKYQMGERAYTYLLDVTPVTDNRGKFF